MSISGPTAMSSVSSTGLRHVYTDCIKTARVVNDVTLSPRVDKVESILVDFPVDESFLGTNLRTWRSAVLYTLGT